MMKAKSLEVAAEELTLYNNRKRQSLASGSVTLNQHLADINPSNGCLSHVDLISVVCRK